jgi:dCMP deaminase
MFSRPSLDRYYTDMLDLVASRSTCIRRAVGAIVVDSKGRLVSIGYNGVPSSMLHCIDHPCPGAGDNPGDNTKCQAIHAEQNALIRAGISPGLSSIYTSTTPCFNCAKLIISSGIRHVISKILYTDLSGINLMREAGIGLMIWSEEFQKTIPLDQYPLYIRLINAINGTD